MLHALTSAMAGVVVAGLVAGPANPPGFASPRRGAVQARTGTVYVSVTDKQGQPVTDLQAAELEVKISGKLRDVVSVEPGLYYPDRGLGVRIEDDYVVTASGFDRISSDAPREMDAIEKEMARRAGISARDSATVEAYKKIRP